MKKIFASALALMMVFSLAACGGSGADSTPPDNSGTDRQESGSHSVATPAPESSGDALEQLLTQAGLTPADITPAEPYFRMIFDQEDGEVFFLMEKDVENNTGAYITQVTNACKAVADDGKLYNADMGFFMHSNPTELEIPPEDEINEFYLYLAQFGFTHEGTDFSVTMSNAEEYDDERNDDFAYPCFSFALSY